MDSVLRSAEECLTSQLECLHLACNAILQYHGKGMKKEYDAVCLRLDFKVKIIDEKVSFVGVIRQAWTKTIGIICIQISVKFLQTGYSWTMPDEVCGFKTFSKNLSCRSTCKRSSFGVGGCASLEKESESTLIDDYQQSTQPRWLWMGQKNTHINHF